MNHFLWIGFCLLASGCMSTAQVETTPSPIDSWRALRFGMFVHWGPVALTGHEIGWSRGRQTPTAEYDELYRRFDPKLFDADAWAATAKAAGMKYLVITAKHHDGFCLWPSAFTDYHIGNTPFGRDVVAELSKACRKHGLEFGIYYSVPDWYHPDYPKGSPAGRTDKPDAEPDRYAEYLRNQVRELVTRYGPLLTLWFDMPREFGPRYGIPTLNMLRKLQPDIVVNNRAYAASNRTGGFGEQHDVGDYNTPEQTIGGFERDRPWETCMTLCRQWAFKPADKMKSLSECLRTILMTIGGDGNLLFNVGPMADGRIEPRQVERLRQMGTFIKRHADGIYGTRGGPFKPGRWGASTCKGERVYLFVMQWPKTGPLLLPAIDAKLGSVRVLDGGTAVVKQEQGAIRVELAAEHRHPVATVIELTLDRPAFAIKPQPVPVMPSGSLACKGVATASNVFRGMDQYAADKAIDDDPDTRWATDAGTAEAWLEVDLGQPRTIGRAAVREDQQFQRVRAFQLRYLDGPPAEQRWRILHQGSTLGPDWSVEFKPVTAQRFQLRILKATRAPTLAEFQLFPPSPGR